MAPDGHARPARGADLPLLVDRHRPLQRRARSDRRSANGGTLAQNDVMEMTKRGVPGVWTYGFYDGWVPELHVLHRALAQLDRPLLRGAELRPGHRTRSGPARRVTSKEWFRPNPPLPFIKWGPRNNTNIQQSARAVLAEPRREEQGALSRELLAEEQARRRRRAKTGRPTRG